MYFYNLSTNNYKDVVRGKNIRATKFFTVICFKVGHHSLKKQTEMATALSSKNKTFLNLKNHLNT